jgi:hypothetical protein
MQGISRLAKEMLAAYEELCAIQSVIHPELPNSLFPYSLSDLNVLSVSIQTHKNEI